MATSAIDSASTTTRLRSGGYQTLLVALLSLNFGIVFFDRQALNALMPFVQPDLNLTNTQIGVIAGGLSFSWAIAAFGIGKLSDTLGNRKLLLVLSTLAFSLCSFLTGVASTFALLLGARLLMGVAEGGVMPISHAIIATEVTPERRGLAMGVGQNLGSNLLGSFLAPVVLVAFAKAFGWHSAFYLAGIPGIASALVIWFMLEEPAAPPRHAHHAPDKMSILDALRIRNIWICVVMGVLLVGFFTITWAFMPLYLSQTRRFDASVMSWIMGTLGISATIGSFVISGISDRIGRRPVMIAMPFIAVLVPLSALFFNGSALTLAVIFFIGWGVVGIFPLYMATIPSESVDARHHATVLGLAMGSCEILGGVFGPPIAGRLNDAFGMHAFLWLMLGLAVAAGIFAMGLKETAPSQVGRPERIPGSSTAPSP